MSVRVGGDLPSSMQAPTGGSQSLIAQNEPITDHTAAGASLISMLRVRLAAEAGKAPNPRATQSGAEQRNAIIMRAFLQLFIVYSFSIAGGMRCGQEVARQTNSAPAMWIPIPPTGGQ